MKQTTAIRFLEQRMRCKTASLKHSQLPTLTFAVHLAVRAAIESLLLLIIADCLLLYFCIAVTSYPTLFIRSTSLFFPPGFNAKETRHVPINFKALNLPN